MKSLMLAAAMCALAAPALAQNLPPATDPGTPRAPLPQDRGYDKPDPRTDAINAPNADTRAATNAAVAAQTAARPTVVIPPEAQAQYQEDIAAYRAALRQHRRTVRADEAFYDRQQRAYADAMFAWRVQVADCKSGITAACNAPAPDPAEFF